MEENANEAVVENGFGAPVGGLCLLRCGKCDDGGVRFTLVAHLQVSDEAKL